MRVLIIENGYKDLIKSRIPLGNFINSNGNSVFYGCPNPNKSHKEEIISLPMKRTKFDFFSLFLSLKKLLQFEKKKNVDVIFSFRLVPNFLNFLSSFISTTKVRVAVITGLGYSFSYKGFKNYPLRLFIKFFYKIASKRIKIIAQNPDDIKQLGIKNADVILGSGVSKSNYIPIVNNNKSLKLLFVGRLLRSKGILDTIEIFKSIKNTSYKSVELIIAGDIDPKNPDSISKNELNDLKSIDGVSVIGYINNLQSLYLDCQVLIFPSVYREGVPRSIIEALSYGLTIVTYDMPGCRETVNQNGILISPKKNKTAINYINKLNNKLIFENANKSVEIFNKYFIDSVIYPQYLNCIKNSIKNR